MENISFTIKDMNKKVYSLHFKHQLFWEIGFLDGTCSVFSCNGALTKNGDKIPGSIEDEGVKCHDNMLSAILDVQTRINKKIQFSGYRFADSDAIINFECIPTGSTSENQINQKRSASSQDFNLSTAKESLFKKLHASYASSASGTSAESYGKIKQEYHEGKANIKLENPEDFQDPNIVPPEDGQRLAINFNPEERKGAYLEKIECGEALFYKIQISENQLLIEEGISNDHHHLKQPEPKICHDYNEAQERMKFLIKEKEKEGFKNIKKKFAYDFHSHVIGQKKSVASSTHAKRITVDLQQNAPANTNAQRKDPALQGPKRSLRSRLEKKYAASTNQAESPQTKPYFSFKPKDWPESKDPTGLILREKLNGVLCVWDGKDKLISLKGHRYQVPRGFIQGFPSVSLLGVVYLGPDSCHNVEMNMRSSKFEIWKKMKFVAYDILGTDCLPFKERMETIQGLLKGIDSPYIEFCKYSECRDQEHLQNEQAIIKEKKGDGLYLNNPSSERLSGVNSGLYVWKNYTFDEAELLHYVFDKNGKVKSFEVRHLKGDNNVFKIHKGVGALTKEERPKIGDIIIYKTMGEKSKGVLSVKSSDETEE